MVAKVDPEICIGCTLCVAACPEVFKMQADKAVAYVKEVPVEMYEQCRTAASDCPVTAIEIMENDIGANMEKYRCIVCGYIYDPQAGDPSVGIKPGTSFNDLPDSWVCPECGVGKDQFEKI